MTGSDGGAQFGDKRYSAGVIYCGSDDKDYNFVCDKRGVERQIKSRTLRQRRVVSIWSVILYSDFVMVPSL